MGETTSAAAATLTDEGSSFRERRSSSSRRKAVPPARLVDAEEGALSPESFCFSVAKRLAMFDSNGYLVGRALVAANTSEGYLAWAECEAKAQSEADNLH